MKNLHFFALLFLFFSCQNQETKIEDTVESQEIKKVSTLDIKALKTPEDVATAWNEAINSRDYIALEKLYDEDIQLYQKRFSKKKVLAKKRKYLEANPEFQQQISGLQVEQQYENTFRVGLNKSYVSRGNEDSTRASLNIIKDKDNGWLIIGENDLATRRKHRETIHECTDFIEKLLRSANNADINDYLDHPNTIVLKYFDDDNKMYVFEFRDNGEITSSILKWVDFDVKTLKLYDCGFGDCDKIIGDKIIPYGNGTELYYDKKLLKNIHNYCR